MYKSVQDTRDYVPECTLYKSFYTRPYKIQESEIKAIQETRIMYKVVLGILNRNGYCFCITRGVMSFILVYKVDIPICNVYIFYKIVPQVYNYIHLLYSINL